MNIVFFGSSKYSAIDEETLFNALGLSLVVTLPDRILGRKKILTPNPVKQFATSHTVPVVTTEKLTDEIINQVAAIHPDFLVVADFGLILPKRLLTLPKKAALNVHHSLLPKYRGSSPAPSAILAGEEKTGVSIIFMNEKVDCGDILAQREYVIKSTDTTDSLLTILNTFGGQLLVEVIKNFEENYKNRIPQKESEATYTKRMSKEDSYVDLEQISKMSSLEIRNWKLEISRMMRAYYPWPTVWTSLRIKNKELRIKILPATSYQEVNPGNFSVLLQPEGKKPMSVKDFINGYPEAKWVEKILS